MEIKEIKSKNNLRILLLKLFTFYVMYFFTANFGRKCVVAFKKEQRTVTRRAEYIKTKKFSETFLQISISLPFSFHEIQKVSKIPHLDFSCLTSITDFNNLFLHPLKLS